MSPYTRLIKLIKPSTCLVLIVDQNNKLVSNGTGFLFKEKNIIATCNHVVRRQNYKIQVKFQNMDPIEADIFLRNELQDLALLKIAPQSLTPLQPTTGKDTEEGEEVIFHGYPLTHTATTHQGIISAIIKDADETITYQIDGTVNPGSSGSPVLNMEGKVIGVVNSTRREKLEVLEKIRSLPLEALKIHNIDVAEMYQSIIENLQLGIGYAVPISYMPELVKKGNKK